MSVLRMLDIYEESIDNAYEQCREILEEQGLYRCMGRFEKDLQNGATCIHLGNDATNHIISLMFGICGAIIETEHPGQKCEYYANGLDSHFYAGTDPNSVKGRLEGMGLTQKEMQEILGDETFEHDLKELFDEGGDIIVYGSKEECGAYNADDERRGANYTDEKFCEFLEENYLNNRSSEKDFCLVLKSGRVVLAM